MLESLAKDTPPFPDSMTCAAGPHPTGLRVVSENTPACKGHSGSETGIPHSF